MSKIFKRHSLQIRSAIIQNQMQKSRISRGLQLKSSLGQLNEEIKTFLRHQEDLCQHFFCDQQMVYVSSNITRTAVTTTTTNDWRLVVKISMVSQDYYQKIFTENPAQENCTNSQLLFVLPNSTSFGFNITQKNA